MVKASTSPDRKLCTALLVDLSFGLIMSFINYLSFYMLIPYPPMHGQITMDILLVKEFPILLNRRG